jgi:hypothetical protein
MREQAELMMDLSRVERAAEEILPMVAAAI